MRSSHNHSCEWLINQKLWHPLVFEFSVLYIQVEGKDFKFNMHLLSSLLTVVGTGNTSLLSRAGPTKWERKSLNCAHTKNDF
jgi:hypothetical protein